MTYTELLERFWDMDRDFSCTETLLYLYLLHRCNSLGWPDNFSLTNDELIERLKCRPTNFRVARNALVEAGLIRYYIGNGRGGISSYSIEGSSEVSEKGVPVGTPFWEKGVRLGTPLEGKSVPTGTPLEGKGVPTGTPLDEKRYSHGNTFSDVTILESAEGRSEVSEKGIPTGTPLDEKGIPTGTPFFEELKEQKQEKKSFPPAPPIKEKKEKKKAPHTNRASADVRACVCENGQFTMFSEDEPVRKRRTPSEQRLPRDMEEVMAFFERNAADKLPDWETEAKLFFYHFDSLGWMGTSNRKIQDWESKANLWISDKAIAIAIKNGERTRQTEIDAGGLPAYGRAAGVPKAWEGGFPEPQRRGRDGREPPDAPKDYTKGF